MKLTEQQMDDMLGAWTDAAGPFDPAATFVGAASAIVDNGDQTAIADVTAAAGSAGTRTAIGAWSAPYTLSDGRRAVDGPMKTFRVASSADSTVINAWYLASLAVAGVLKAWGTIPDPVYLPNEDHAWHLIVRLTLDPNGRFSAEYYFS